MHHVAGPVWTSCQAALNSDSTAASGTYRIQPAAADAAYDVYCDMDLADGGWTFVNEAGRSTTDIDDLYQEAGGGYHVFSYDTKGALFDQVLVQRVSSNWCDSWGRNTGNWVESDGASMGIQVDEDYFHYYNNRFSHTWLKAPNSYRTTCSSCWTYNSEPYHYTSEFTASSESADGSLVKIDLNGMVSHSRLEVQNYDSFIQQAGGCDASGAVYYRVFIRQSGVHGGNGWYT